MPLVASPLSNISPAISATLGAATACAPTVSSTPPRAVLLDDDDGAADACAGREAAGAETRPGAVGTKPLTIDDDDGEEGAGDEEGDGDGLCSNPGAEHFVWAFHTAVAGEASGEAAAGKKTAKQGGGRKAGGQRLLRADGTSLPVGNGPLVAHTCTRFSADGMLTGHSRETDADPSRE